MFPTAIDKLEMVEWYDDFLKRRIKTCGNEEIKDIYREGVRWCGKQRILLANKLI